ncbi:MAG: TetR/AcrR family transcriptional regulator [Aggregatilineales bacterium]
MEDAIQAQIVALKKGQILDSATQVFAEKGFHKATIKDIAKVAGIADGTVYNYFENKTALLLGILDRLNESEQREVDLGGGMDGDFRAFFVRYLRHRLDVVFDNADIFRAILPELLVNAELRETYYNEVIAPTMTLAEAMFAERMSGGQMRQTNPALATQILAGTVFGLLNLYLLGAEEIASQRDEMAEVIATMVWDGLGK